MRTLKLTLAYDGTNYAGWQRQANALSVQQVVEDAFAPLVNGVPPTVAGASRTDAGTHALGQVASVNAEIDLTPVAVQRALNVRLPFDIRVLGVVDATPGFHARFQAAGKSYRYRMITTPVMSPFDRFYAWHAPEPKRIELMQEAAALLVGTHDFASFQARGAFVRETVRTIERLDLRESGGEIVLECEGDGFLRHMVRAIAGTLAEIGTGLREPAAMREILEARDRKAAGATAPAHGLTLVAVKY
ncbi:MAG TPA: tRNA pseudouridine(38-40) synthase TruA [Vicinamibacterales bacterium]|nr:tRNA pseudouridine(38-40) synthase TruA [Vicinamibacterales bacterium]